MPKSTLSNEHHSIAGEIEFLKGLGTGAYRESKHDREWHLRQYVKNFNQREKWDKINPEAVLVYALEMIRQLGG